MSNSDLTNQINQPQALNWELVTQRGRNREPILVEAAEIAAASGFPRQQWNRARGHSCASIGLQVLLIFVYQSCVILSQMSRSFQNDQETSRDCPASDGQDLGKLSLMVWRLPRGGEEECRVTGFVCLSTKSRL